MHGQRAGETRIAGAAARPMPHTRSRCAVRVHRAHTYSYIHAYDTQVHESERDLIVSGDHKGCIAVSLFGPQDPDGNGLEAIDHGALVDYIVDALKNHPTGVLTYYYTIHILLK